MNFFESILSSEFIRAFAWTLLHSVWQGGLIAFMAVVFLIILRKHRPGIRYLILYIFLMLLPVFFTATFLYTYHPENAKVLSIIRAEPISGLQDSNILHEKPFISENGVSDAWYVHVVYIFENQAGWLVLLWFIGFFIFLLRFSGSLLYVYHLKNYKAFPVEECWNANLRKLSERIGLQKPVRLAESAIARIPMTIGYLKPVILLPLGTLSGVPPQQIDAILLHEMAHILRKDYLLNILQSVVELLFFYHPVTWWLSGLIRQEREHVCDDLAIAVNHDYLNYIKALTTMEELNSKSPLLASAMTGSKKKLLFRVKRLLTPLKFRKGFGEGIIAFILIIGLVFTLSFNALSFIPSAYDLTGRESGERVYSLLPFQTNAPQEASVTASLNRPDVEISINPETPDTIIAKSKSGKITIRICTDSTSQVQQEKLDRMAENMDKQAQQYEQAMKNYQIQMEKFEDGKKGLGEECKVIVLRKSDSTSMASDSVIVIYNDSRSSFPGHHFEYRVPQPDFPVSPHTREFRYLYSHPDIPDMESFDKELFPFKCDSIDTIIFMGPREHMDLDKIKEFEWSDKQLNDYLLYNLPPLPPEPLENVFIPEHRVTSAEKIIRQELRDDGLTVPRKGYIIDLDSKGMYINGEKQSKETFRKYKRLVESLESANIDGGDVYRIIF
jgi:beta-lactamase regulating signal transducer with metallopeptidase domain